MNERATTTTLPKIVRRVSEKKIVGPVDAAGVYTGGWGNVHIGETVSVFVLLWSALYRGFVTTKYELT